MNNNNIFWKEGFEGKAKAGLIFRTFELNKFIKTNKINIFLNFAAIKHVRSEENIHTLKYLFETNCNNCFNFTPTKYLKKVFFISKFGNWLFQKTPHIIKGTAWIVRYVFRHWQLRNISKVSWFSSDKTVFFFSYFIYIFSFFCNK